MAQCPPVRRTTRMARRGRQAKCPTACPPPTCPTPPTPKPSCAPARCMRPGPVQRNPFLNFLREYRKTCCGLTAIETVRQGAKAWKALPKEKRQRFIVEAFYAPKRKRRLSDMCGSVGRRKARRSGRITKRCGSAASRRKKSRKRASRRKTKMSC